MRIHLDDLDRQASYQLEALLILSENGFISLNQYNKYTEALTHLRELWKELIKDHREVIEIASKSN